MTEVEIGENNMSNIFDKYFEGKTHTINARKCINCSKGMRPPINGRESKTDLCHACVNDRDNLPEKFFCKGINSKGKRCRVIVIDGYCSHHKIQGESNGEN